MTRAHKEPELGQALQNPGYSESDRVLSTVTTNELHMEKRSRKYHVTETPDHAHKPEQLPNKEEKLGDTLENCTDF